MSRDIDWRAYLNRLVYCYGCGKFGLPRKGKGVPSGWKLLYQPHANAPPGLHACSRACDARVREAMQEGPVLEPLQVGTPPMMDADLRQQMMDELFEETEREMEQERRHLVNCVCGKTLNPMTHQGIPRFFSCPHCGAEYEAKFNSGHVVFDSKEERPDETVPRPAPGDPGEGDPEG